MPNKLAIAFSGMMVGGATFLISGTAVYLAMAQVQDRLEDRTMQAAKLQDRVIQAQGTTQPTWTLYAQLPPTP